MVEIVFCVIFDYYKKSGKNCLLFDWRMLFLWFGVDFNKWVKC